MEMFNDSESGTKAAWKGFSSQTLYIANRLLCLNDDSNFYPEKVEDLLIKKNGIPIESVQVKNITANLTISHFNPQKPDSFFKRSLSLRKENIDIKLVVVSFGPLGAELNDIKSKEQKAIHEVAEKLMSQHSYAKEDAEWILERLEIHTVDQSQLESQIFNKLNEFIETMSAPKLAFDVLTSYISRLSLTGGKTSRSEWNMKLHHIATDFAAMSGFQQEYGRSLIPLFEYKSNMTFEQLKEQFRMGVNAHPDHIRNNLDLKRVKRIEYIEKSFDNNQIVIIKSASGQGKTSLAYRYLIDHYPETNVFLIEQIENGIQATNIIAALSGLFAARENNLIVYIDVKPYQTGWVEILHQLLNRGKKIKLLVTIREEDYQRTVVDKSNFLIPPEEIELTFGKVEAEWIYEQYKPLRFRNFEEAWSEFHETGPLMEFIYLLNQTESLRHRLEAQINKIKIEETESQDWLKFLRLFAYVGKNNIKLNLNNALNILECRNFEKMMHVFEKEYFLRLVENNKYVEPLHAIRAKLIYSILKDEIFDSEEELLIKAIQSVDEYSQMLVMDHFYDNGYSLQLIERIAKVKINTWSNYASTVKGILWLEVFDHYQINREALFEGDKESNNSFSFIALPDITGLLGEWDLTIILEIMKKSNPKGEKRFRENINRIPKRYLEFRFIDKFFEISKDNIPNYLPETNIELSNMGYALFWMSIRGFLIAPFINEKIVLMLAESADIDSILDFTEGVYSQKWHGIYKSLLSKLRDKLCFKFKLVTLEETDESISSHFITEIFNTDIKNKNLSAHSQAMTIIHSLRKLFPGKKQYATKIIGADFLEGIPVIDGEKNINTKYLPNVWITELNNWFHNLTEYEYRPNNWNEYLEKIIDIRKSATDCARIIIEGIDYLYKKGGNLNKLTRKEAIELITETSRKVSKNTLLPKNCIDRFGLITENNTEKYSDNSQTNDHDATKPNYIQSKVSSGFRLAFIGYCNHFSNFLNQMDELIISRIENPEIENKGHLSLINLLDSVSQIKAIQLEFNNLFSNLIDLNEVAQLCNKEEAEMSLLLEVWQFFGETKLQKFDSLAYTRKELIKKRKHTIESFFTQKLHSISGVKNISSPILQINGDINIYLTVDIMDIDTFVIAFYREFKSNFSNATPLSVESLHILSYITNIIIVPIISSYPMPNGLKVEVSNLINFDEEKFIKYITPYERDEYIENKYINLHENTLPYYWCSLFSSISIIQLIFSHVVKTNQALSELRKSTIIINGVFWAWNIECEAILSKIISKMQIDFQSFSEKSMEKSEYTGHLEVIKEALGNLDKDKDVLTRPTKTDQIVSIFEKMKVEFMQLISYL